MRRRSLATFGCCLVLGAICGAAALAGTASANEVDRLLARENEDRGVKLQAASVVDDLVFLRRVSVDLVGRIPTHDEIQEYLAWPAQSRREQVVDQLLQHERFADRWTVFFADMLRLRSNAEGGAALVAFVHNAVKEGTPYDEMCRRLIATNGKVGRTPEVGFVLGDNADPMALAGVTSQVFLGVRIACAQCHDHPFDVWTREDFYGFAAYFGKTRRVQRQFNNRILSTYTTDVTETAILWPPEGVGEPSARKPMKPRFPFEMAEADDVAKSIARLAKLRSEQQKKSQQTKSDVASIDDLLSDAADAAEKRTSGSSLETLDVASEAKRDVRSLDVTAGGYQPSDFRLELANLVTDPRNRYFSRSFANRVWAELVGRGIVSPVDDFSTDNPPSHPATLDYLADEFVAHGYDLRSLVRLIVTSQAYQRAQVSDADEAVRVEMEAAFLATPMRRMISEVLYDSIVTAGRLFEVKHEAGKNMTTVWQLTRIMKQPTDSRARVNPVALAGAEKPAAMPAMKEKKSGAAPGGGYNLENAIELDFNAILAANDDEVEIDKMQVMSKEELEAERMQQEAQRRQADYIDRFVKTTFDDNPVFTTSLRMQSPAPPGHFLRVFGQPTRSDLGEVRDHNPSMRQALMMLNGRLTHEAARVGELEPIYPLLVGKKADLTAAIRLVYVDILTREPSAEEITDAKAIITDADNPLDGMADFRWVLLNSNEFRFLP